jgi:SpoVK/Ycf46/Vps4 family AAA+-type ATPase
MSSQWHDLFVATSPSKTADKSNMLMIGPQGCGKSQAMRGIGADEGSIAIFAQGSDFLTCWMGEADKNPKRLFQAAVRLQKETNKQVYILIDECDSVMKKQELKSHGEVDLTLEFQILMDGVVHYPHITIIGATNRPGHIPMPMIRRFSKVLIVGELNEADRIRVLKHYVGFMPTKGFKDRDWESAALKLDGATGDVLRKVVDVIWRKKMTWFVKNQTDRAEELKKWLNDGTKFEVTSFNAKRRAQFKKLLGPFVKIEPADLVKSIDAHLKNVAIQGEIRTARQTYEEAHELLDDLDSSGLILAN